MSRVQEVRLSVNMITRLSLLSMQGRKVLASNLSSKSQTVLRFTPMASTCASTRPVAPQDTSSLTGLRIRGLWVLT